MNESRNMNNLEALFCMAIAISILFLVLLPAHASLANPDSVSQKDSSNSKSVDLSRETANPDDSTQKQIEFHLRKALYFIFVKSKISNARAEISLAEQIYRAKQENKELLAELGFIAACWQIAGDKENSRKLFDELKSGRLATGKPAARPELDYAVDLIDLAGVSILKVDSFAVAESITKEALHELSLAAKNDDALSAKAQMLLGTLQLKSGDSKQAVLTLQKAQSLCSANKDSSDACQADMYLAKALLAQKKYSELEALCRERIEIERMTGLKNGGLPSVVASLAGAYYETGKTAAASNLLEEWKRELQKLDTNAQYMTLLREFSELQSTRKQDMDSAELNNEATNLYEIQEASKCAINAMISHYYVLNEFGLAEKARQTFDLETRLRKLENKSAKARELIGTPQKESAQELSPEQKHELELDNYEVKRALDAYHKQLLQGDHKSRLGDLDEIIKLFQQKCS